ncbi:hypothetical protein BDW59DRAFT_38882 [Aspergillus cavernicola]|uniref:Protein kinase domain-containing protein n=1 Tax=Aspergillus cavernicola TaxID=176166 RepID=A0ABR4HAT5_9EURO
MSFPQTSTFDKPRLFFSSDPAIEKCLAAGNVNIITFITLVQKMKMSILPLTWQSDLQLLGRGGTSHVNQSLVDLETSFAFKRVAEKDRLEKTDAEIFLRLMNEVYILCNTAVMNHAYILQLQGICWDVPFRTHQGSSPEPLQDDKVWPVLVFQKAHFGDLNTFAQRPIGQELDLAERWRICLEVGVAIAHMQSQNVIHGDVKPENILIFKGDDDAAFTAKVGDFGFSISGGHDSTSVSVPRSWPWYAPECDVYPRLLYPQAIKTDVFSYGLLCLWFMFGRHFSSIPSSAEVGMLHSSSSTSTLRLLDELKRKETLVLYATQLVMTEETLDAEQKQVLQSFFSGCLACNPAARATDVRSLLNSVRKDAIPQQIADMSLYEKDLLNNGDFKVCNSLRHFYFSDYRVRAYIVRQLEALVLQDPTVELSTQLAICYRLGFAATEEDRRLENLIYSDKEMNEQIQKAAESEPAEYAGVLYRSLLKMGNHSPISVVDYYEAHGVLEAAELTIRCDIKNLQTSLGIENQIVLSLKDQLSSMLGYQGRWAEAQELEVELRDTRERILGEEHPHTLDSMSSLALVYSNQGKLEEAVELFTKVMDTSQRILSPDHASIQTLRANLAATYWKQGRWTEAEELQAKILKDRQQMLGDEHPSTLNSMLNLASIYRDQGSLEAAEELETKVLRERERMLGRDHPQTLAVMANLAITYHSRGDWKRAETLAATALKKRQRVLGREHPDTLTSMGTLAVTYRDQAMWGEAETLQAELLATRERVLGPDHPETLGSKSALALTYWGQGRWQEAQSLQEYVLEASLRTQGIDHPNTLNIMTSLASTYWSQGQYAAAETLQASALERLTELFGPAHPDTLTSMANLAATYFAMDRLEEAKDLQEQVLTRSVIVLGKEHPDTLNSMANLASMWHGMERWAEAESLQQRLVATATETLGPEHPQTLMNKHNLAVTYSKQNRYEEARELIGKVLDVQQRVLGPEHPLTLVTVENLAALCELPEDHTGDEDEGLMLPDMNVPW